MKTVYKTGATSPDTLKTASECRILCVYAHDPYNYDIILGDTDMSEPIPLSEVSSTSEPYLAVSDGPPEPSRKRDGWVPVTPLPQDSEDPKFKTSLCRNFMMSLSCSYGNRCSFAHGEHELRVLSRQPWGRDLQPKEGPNEKQE